MSANKHQVTIKDIRPCPLFAGMNDAELGQIAGLVEIRRLKDGEELAKEGEPGEEIYILLEGALEVKQKLTLFAEEEIQGRNSRDKMLIKLKSDNCPAVGEMSLFEENYRRSATMRAIGACNIGVIGKHTILKLTQEDQHLGYRLFYNIGFVLSARLKKANQDVLKLTTAFSLAMERGK